VNPALDARKEAMGAISGRKHLVILSPGSGPTMRQIENPVSPVKTVERKRCPVFVMGCHRSGTNLLYDTLLSAGNFAVYRGYLPVHEVLIPRFGKLDDLENRKKLLRVWLHSKGFRRSELDPGFLRTKILEECRNGGDFIRIHMDEIARSQNVDRWAVYDPDAALHLPEIKADIPECLFVHIIRDGRDIAVSLKKMGGFNPFPWDRQNRSLSETALYWQWFVRKGREHGRTIPSDYLEIHYEDLILDPRNVLRALGEFIDHDLDYDRIQNAKLGRLRESNSSFRADNEQRANPIGRWKEKLSREEVAQLEALIGECLEEFGYTRSLPQAERGRGFRHSLLNRFYPAMLNAKLLMKTRTPLGRFSNLSVLELENNPNSNATSG